ncbi:hypothetical protein FVE85_0343 [Porphyridium purpureum]|uniref:NADH:ubiquinone oxidoreductase intermediate-associated protein 30 domain-containing protein n=1 Tax=Porphyridium purpureum TaxID=35688 RepID=A0A5J4Z127_PORPP|nr:hypothetical protein FVE85_0343 [Porphyridium purpureum]|eukprot:POR6887..scf208_2
MGGAGVLAFAQLGPSGLCSRPNAPDGKVAAAVTGRHGVVARKAQAPGSLAQNQWEYSLPGSHSRSRSRSRSPSILRMGREAWPLRRFVRDLLFFTPVGKAIGLREDVSTVSTVSRKVRADTGSKSVGAVLVTGATGGTGRRVVKLLQERGYAVKALVRNEQRAKDVLSKSGVQLQDGSENTNHVTFCVGDLYNIHPDFFDGVSAIISCTGVKVGPVDDTPDRAKYYQGLKFYPPEILEDTPENVEYVGVKNLASKVAAASLSGSESGASGSALLSFKDPAKINRTWGVVDDIVMGGVSSSSIAPGEPGVAVFSGMVSTSNNGGFASVRTAPFARAANLSAAKSFTLRVKGDGQRYKFIVRCDSKWDGPSFCYSFDTKRGEWQDIEVPFGQLLPVFRAKTMRDGTRFDPASVFAVQFMLSKFEYDGALNPSFRPGAFELQIAAVDAVTAADSRGRSSKAQTPLLIHVGSAGVTRVLRASEFPDLESQPPAVRMNKMLGRMMEWKLAGEDAIRASGVPYLIVRPCALTEEAPRGYGGLKVSQGDTMTGKVSRDDLARVLVDALGCGSLTNKTFELATRAEDDGSSLTSLTELCSNLVDDASTETKRTYASFPFVPL